jgi:subtilisin family serine protease
MGVPPSASGLDGRGVVIGFVDYGFDLLHPALCDGEGRTRFAALLDQNFELNTAGRELPAKDLQKLMDAARVAGSRPPADSIYDPHANHFGPGEPIAAHGTLVASIAAGSACGHFRGVAPAARLIGVQLAVQDEDWKEQDVSGTPTWVGHSPDAWKGWRSYDDSERIASAIEYIWRRARSLGASGTVINLSIGAYAGAHDGRSRVERTIAEIASRSAAGEGSPCAIVVAAGNAGAGDAHFTAEVTPAAPVNFAWRMRADQRRQKRLEVWYRSEAPLRVALAIGAEGTDHAVCSVDLPPGPARSLEGNSQQFGIAEHTARCRVDLSCIRVLIHPPYLPSALRTGTCDVACSIRITVPEPSGNAVVLHAWIEREDDFRETSTLFPSHPSSTVTSLATAEGAIVVSAYDHHRGPRQASFAPSSLGPAPWPHQADLRAPLVAAPGGRLWGARSKSDGFIETAGTSAAAALTSGAIALLMQREARRGHRLEQTELATMLVDDRSPSAQAQPTQTWDPRWGYGPVNIGEWQKDIAA